MVRRGGRRAWVAAAMVVAAAGLCHPHRSWAQEAVKAFDQLNTRLKVGDTIYVTDAQGREHKGRVTEIGAASLGLRAGPELSFGEADIRTIEQRRPDSLGNGALIGLAVGAGLVGVAMAFDGSKCDSFCALALLVYGGAGAGIGVGIDALIPGKKLVVYRAPGGAAKARLVVKPLITPRAKGVAVAFTF